MDAPSESWWVANRAEQFRMFARTDGQTAPLYGRLGEGVADDPEVLGLLDAAPPSQQRSVLLFAATHFLVLGDPGCELARHYSSMAADPAEGDPWPAFRSFCLDHRAEVSELIATRSTQTNEVGRGAAIVPGLETIHRATGQPLTLLEVGSSAGLNLLFDRYRIEWSAPKPAAPPWPGFTAAQAVGPADSPVVIGSRAFGDRSLPVDASGATPPIRDRAGLDLAPIDVQDSEATRWLEACIFPDRVDRLQRLRAALALARRDPPRIETGDAIGDLARVAATLPGDGPLVVFHSWALTYVDDKDGFARAVADLAGDRDVWWLSIEPSTAVPGLVVPPRDPRYTDGMAANTVTALVHLTAGARHDQVLARSHPHLDWIHWLP